MSQETIPLDQEAIELIAEMLHTIRSSETSISTVLSYFCRQRKIRGTVRLADDRRSIIVTLPDQERSMDDVRELVNA